MKPRFLRMTREERAGRRDERGATLVEFGLVSVLLFALIFFIIEGAFVVRARNTVNNAVDDAARRGAVAARAPTADFFILQQLVGRGVGVNSAGSVQKVIVYRTTNGSGTMNAGCQTASVATWCNVYTAADLLRPASDFGNDCGAGGIDSAWCATSRGSGGNLNFLGVYVETQYEPIIGTLFVDLGIPIVADSLQAIETSGES